MEHTENDFFDEEWRQAFEGAEPSKGLDPLGEHVWMRIERQLPRDRRVIPLWYWWAAAGVAMTLLAGGLGWWAGRMIGSENPTSFAQTTSKGKPVSPSAMPFNELPTEQKALQQPQIASPSESMRTARSLGEQASNSINNDQFNNGFKKKNTGLNASKAQSHEGKQPDWVARKDKEMSSGNPASLRIKREITPQQAEPNQAFVAKGLVAVQKTSPSELSSDAAQPNAVQISFLETKAIKNRPVRLAVNLRTNLPFSATATTTATPPPVRASKAKREIWIGLNASPVGFDSRTRLSGAAATAVSSAYGANLTSRVGAANSTSSQPALSYRVGGSVGAQLSRHWWIQSGLEYLHGESAIQNGLFLYDQAAAYSLIHQNLAQGYPITGNQVNGTQLSALASLQKLTSTYHYLSVPLQVGYQFGSVRQRLTAGVSSGVSGDVFLSNSLKPVDSPSLSTVNYTNADGVYNPLVLSGLMGANLRYRLAPHWGVLLEGTYRQALTRGTTHEASVQTYPREMGAGMRLQYRF